MNDKQPEALRLADEQIRLLGGTLGHQTSAELRRQHQEIQELKQAKEELLDALQSLIDEYEPNMKTFATDAPRKAKWMAALAAAHLHKD